MSVVTEYIEKLNDGEKAALTHLRQLVYEVVPDAEDAFSYGVPIYRYKGKYLIGFASNKHFMSIYPGPEGIAVLKDELGDHIRSKATITFTPDQPIADSTIKTLIAFCKDTIDQKNKS